MEREQLPDIRERLKGILRPGGYDPGDIVSARIKDAEGVEHDAEFEILRFCGGGFAGQVYRARLLNCADDCLAPDQDYALKLFTPRSRLRGKFRDLLYFLGFQSPFPHQYNEAAVRTGIYMTKLLRYVSQVEFGGVGPINDCYATFWDDHIGAFAEVNEWVEGRVTDPDVDSGIFTRRRRAKESGGTPEPATEISRKKAFMKRIVELCGELGIEDLARQVYWWTGMSQANVLTRNSGTPDAEFVWVDRRPGLPGFLLSLGDFPLLINALFRGSIPPFDKINFKKLRSWSKAPDPEAWQSIVDELETVDTSYHRAQVDVISHHIRLLSNKKLRMGICAYIADYWRRSGRIDAAACDKMQNGGIRMLPHLVLSCIPLIGVRLQKIVGNAEYRVHVSKMLSSGRYRWDYFDQHRKIDLAMWLRDKRISDKRAERVLGSLPAFFRDRLCSFWVIGIPFLIALPWILKKSSWPWWAFVGIYAVLAALITLPPSWQMFFTDWAVAKDSLRRLFTSPFKYIFNVSHRRKVNLDWIHERTEEDIRHGYVGKEDAKIFESIAGADAMQQYITGIMFTAAVKPVSEIVLVVAGAEFLKIAHEARTLQHIGWWMLPAAVAIAMISPAGVLRFGYCLVQWARNRHVPYGIATALAYIRGVGDLAFMVQIAKTYPQFSGYLLTSSLCHLVNMVPVFGERGGLLNIWVATVFLSWPASLKALLRERRGISQA